MEFKHQKLAKNLKHIAGQKFTWFAFSMALLSYTAFSTRPEAQETSLNNSASQTTLVAATPPSIFTSSYPFAAFATDNNGEEKGSLVSNKLITYAKSLLGRPYSYGGTTKKGFDCSGFVYHIFQKFDIDINRSSRTQSIQGTEVDVEEIRPGDLLFFTGTDPKIREVGHVGIVISKPGEPISFIHSSSNGGVKISELEGYYNTRFMFAKRMD